MNSTGKRHLKARKNDLENRKRDPAVVSRTMARVKAKDSKIEIKMRKALWAEGLRYRKHYRKAFGVPDIAFTKQKVAVFCDSSFWHGLDWENQKKRIVHNRDFWINKIRKNMERDKLVNRTLKESGWLVIRCSDVEIEMNIAKCVAKIKNALKRRDGSSTLG